MTRKSSTAAIPAPTGPDTLQMVSPDGVVQTVRATQAGTLAALGYRQMTPELAQQQGDEDKYGGSTLGEVGAGALGFARGATLGLSDLAIRAAERGGLLPGGTTEDVRKLKEFNPDASIAGELSSFAVPALGAVKALGAAGKVARAAGIAQESVGAVGKTLGEVASKIVGEHFGEYVAPAVRMAAETALFQAGKNISEESLQNRDLTVESVLAHTGDAAILGGGIGGALPIGLRAAKAGAEAALKSKAADWLLDGTKAHLEKFIDPERSTQIFSGAMRNELNPDKGEKFQEAVAALRKKGLYGRGDVEVNFENATFNVKNAGRLPDQESLLSRIDNAQDNLIDKRKAVFDDIDSAITTPKFSFGGTEQWAPLGGNAAKAQKKFQKEFITEVTDFSPSAKANLRNLANDLRRTGVIDDTTEATALVDKYRKLMKETGGSLSKLQELKDGIYNTVKEANYAAAKIGGKAPPSIQLLKQIGRYVKENIDFGVERVKNEQAYRGLANQVASVGEINQTLSELATVRKPLADRIAANAQNVNVLGGRFQDMLAGTGGAFVGNAIGGPIGGLLGLGVGAANKILQTDRGLLLRAELGEKLQTLGWLQKTTDAAQKNIAKSMAGFLSHVDTSSAARALSDTVATPIARPIAVFADRDKPKESSTTARASANQQWFSDVSKQLQEISADPQTFAARQQAQIGALKANAPETTDAIISKQLQIYSFLLQNMPKNPHPAPLNLFGSTWTPADYEIDRFRDLVRVAKNPMSALNDLKAGTLTRRQTQAIQALYPATYQSMMTTARELVTKPGVTLTYEQRLKLGTLFPGIESSMRPEFIGALSTSSQPQGGSRNINAISRESNGYRPGGAAKMQHGDRLQTKTDSLSAR